MNNGAEERKERLKELIRALHAGVPPEEVKGRFRELLREIGPSEISKAEQELIEEGMPPEEVHRLCDLHLAVLKESLEGPELQAPPGHPIHILLREHEFVRGVIEELTGLLPRLEQAEDLTEVSEELHRIEELLGHLREYDKHKVREENALFPYLERHGVTQPPAIMWTEHDQQREQIKGVGRTLGEAGEMDFGEFKGDLTARLEALRDLVLKHFYKEERVLFPTALELIGEDEWLQIKASMDELGYCYFTPPEAVGERAIPPGTKGAEGGEVTFGTGTMTQGELEAMLNTLPLDITFVDAEDRVRYFNEPRERLFPRTKAIIGRTVQQCHPQKSLPLVNRILEEFKSGQRDVAEFWIDVKGRKVHIRYFAVRDSDGRYLGCVEATQDVTDLKKLEGEKRLLDEP